MSNDYYNDNDDDDAQSFRQVFVLSLW